MTDISKLKHKRQLKKLFFKNLAVIFVPVLIVFCVFFLIIYQLQIKNSIQIASVSESGVLEQRTSKYIKIIEEKEKILDELLEKQDFLDFYLTKDILDKPKNFKQSVKALSDFSRTIKLNNSYIEMLGIYSESNDYMLKSRGSPKINDDILKRLVLEVIKNDTECTKTYISNGDSIYNKRIVFLKNKKFNDINVAALCTVYYHDLIEKIGGFDDNVASMQIIKNDGEVFLENINFDIDDSKSIMKEKVLQDGTKLIFKIDVRKLIHPSNSISSEILLICVVLVILVIAVTLFVNYRIFLPFKKINNILDNDTPDSEDKTRVWSDYKFIIDNLTRVVESKYILETKMIEQLEEMKVMQNIALQDQIKPHFIFNTLQVIGFYADELTVEENKVAYMIEKMSQMLRYSMSNDSSVVKIKDELDYIKTYVMFQQENYYDKFDFVCNIPQNILENKIVKITLQPLVENAIKYGIKPSNEKCLLEIKGTCVDNVIYLDVFNTGIVIEEEIAKEINSRLEENNKNTTHIGLSNVNKRIKIIFGNDYGVSIFNKNNEKTLCRICIPKIAN